jgi:hypothetical protein
VVISRCLMLAVDKCVDRLLRDLRKVKGQTKIEGRRSHRGLGWSRRVGK